MRNSSYVFKPFFVVVLVSKKLLDRTNMDLIGRTLADEQIATSVDTHGEDHHPLIAVALLGARHDLKP